MSFDVCTTGLQLCACVTVMVLVALVVNYWCGLWGARQPSGPRNRRLDFWERI